MENQKLIYGVESVEPAISFWLAREVVDIKVRMGVDIWGL
jgi:hypothetical protein